MKKGDPGYQVTQKRLLVPEPGTELVVSNILSGIKQFSGEKIQWYLASELRDRIRHSGVEIRVIDRTARAEFKVEPRKFEGRLLTFERLRAEIAPLEAELLGIIDEQRRAEEEETSRDVLRSIQKAIKEALLALPAEEYDWFDLHNGGHKKGKAPGPEEAGAFKENFEEPCRRTSSRGIHI